MASKADWFDYAHSFSDDEGAWDRLRETHTSLPDLEFEIECGGEMHEALMTQTGLRVSHSDLELEQALNAMGGEPPECLRVHRLVEFVRRGQGESKPAWMFLLNSDSELEAILARPGGPTFITFFQPPVRGIDGSISLQDLMLLPEVARRRLAVTLVVDFMGDRSPLFRNRAAQVCLRLLDPDFQPDRDMKTALSIVRAMVIEERP